MPDASLIRQADLCFPGSQGGKRSGWPREPVAAGLRGHLARVLTANGPRPVGVGLLEALPGSDSTALRVFRPLRFERVAKLAATVEKIIHAAEDTAG